MTAMSLKSLRDRWRTPVGQALAEEVVARLMTCRPLEELGLGAYEGRVDLRGLPAPIPHRLRRFEADNWFVEQLGDLVKFQSAELARLDLTGAQLQSFRFFDSHLIDCRFDAANCRDWRLWGTEVRDCTFRKADLREAAVGTGHEDGRNVWRRVDFSGADFRVGVSWEAIYEDCNWSDARLVKVNFGQCTFVRCRFAGLLREVFFDGRDLPDRSAPPPMEEVDFTEAVFDQVEFRGFDIKAVKLPDDPDVYLIPHALCVARRGLAMLDGDERVIAKMLRAMLEGYLRGPGSEHEACVFNRRDYLQLGGEELAALAQDVLGRAEAECLKG